MSDFDRELIELIDDVTGGQVLSVCDLVESYGTAPVGRVIADGFGAVFLVPDSASDFHEAVNRALHECRFLTIDEALAVVHLSPVPSDYRIHQAPGAYDLEDEPNLLFRYAADDPEAVAEVRRMHAERCEPAEQQRRKLWKQLGKTL